MGNCHAQTFPAGSSGKRFGKGRSRQIHINPKTVVKGTIPQSVALIWYLAASTQKRCLPANQSYSEQAVGKIQTQVTLCVWWSHQYQGDTACIRITQKRGDIVGLKVRFNEVVKPPWCEMYLSWHHETRVTRAGQQREPPGKGWCPQAGKRNAHHELNGYPFSKSLMEGWGNSEHPWYKTCNLPDASLSGRGKGASWTMETLLSWPRPSVSSYFRCFWCQFFFSEARGMTKACATSSQRRNLWCYRFLISP